MQGAISASGGCESVSSARITSIQLGTGVAAAEYGAVEQLAAQGAAISTLACFVVTPVLMLLL